LYLHVAVKVHFVKRLLESGEDIIDGASENITWFYGIYQPAYDKMLRSVPNIKFLEGVPGDLESMINPSLRNLVVIDDLMQELSNDPGITKPKPECHFYSTKHFSSGQRTEEYELELPLLGFVQIST